MSQLTDFRLLSFDVYGTLIDYETGILAGLEPLLNACSNQQLSRKDILELYHELEAGQQTKTPDMPYQHLSEEVYIQLAARIGLHEPSAEETRTFGHSIGTWPAYPDTVEALKRLSKHYRLVVLSNVDINSFENSRTGPLQDFEFDMIITAQDVGSYKPDLRNFEYMLEQVKAKFDVNKERVLQTAQSQFHDHQPAKKMDIKSSWIVRPGRLMGNRPEAVYTWKFDTLAEMADAVEQEAQTKGSRR